jgi:predicted  nucleic acid-binding Zn-ribbon protein
MIFKPLLRNILMAERRIESKEAILSKTTYRPAGEFPVVHSVAGEKYNKAVEIINKLGEQIAFNRRLEEYKTVLGAAQNVVKDNQQKLDEIRSKGPVGRFFGYFTARSLEKQNAVLSPQIQTYQREIGSLGSQHLQKKIEESNKQLRSTVHDPKLLKEITAELNKKLLVNNSTLNKLHDSYAKKETEEEKRVWDEYMWKHSERLPEAWG